MNPKTWATGLGDIIKISDMTDEYIRNCISRLECQPLTIKVGYIDSNPGDNFYSEEEDTERTKAYIEAFKEELTNREIKRLKKIMSDLDKRIKKLEGWREK